MQKNLAKKILTAFLVLGFLFPVFSFAQSAGDLQSQIQALTTQLQQLEQQLAQLQNGSTDFCHTFSTNLGEGQSGSEVTALQTALQMSDMTVVVNGSFDDQTASAVTGFQEKYASDILTPLGLQYGTGYVGSATRTKLNTLYGCGTASGTSSTVGANGGTSSPANCPLSTAQSCSFGYTSTSVVGSNSCKSTSANTTTISVSTSTQTTLTSTSGCTPIPKSQLVGQNPWATAAMQAMPAGSYLSCPNGGGGANSIAALNAEETTQPPTPNLAGQLNTIYGNLFAAAGNDATFNGTYTGTRDQWTSLLDSVEGQTFMDAYPDTSIAHITNYWDYEAPIVQSQLNIVMPPINTLALYGFLSVNDTPTAVSGATGGGTVEASVDNAQESDSGGQLSDTYDPNSKTLNVQVGDEIHYEWSGDALGGGSSKLQIFSSSGSPVQQDSCGNVTTPSGSSWDITGNGDNGTGNNGTISGTIMPCQAGYIYKIVYLLAPSDSVATAEYAAETSSAPRVDIPEAVINIVVAPSSTSVSSPYATLSFTSPISSSYYQSGKSFILSMLSNQSNVPFYLCSNFTPGTGSTGSAHTNQCTASTMTTNSDGSYTWTGTWDNSAIGTWTEWVKFGSYVSPTMTFTVTTSSS